MSLNIKEKFSAIKSNSGCSLTSLSGKLAIIVERFHSLLSRELVELFFFACPISMQGRQQETMPSSYQNIYFHPNLRFLVYVITRCQTLLINRYSFTLFHLQDLYHYYVMENTRRRSKITFLCDNTLHAPQCY